MPAGPLDRAVSQDVKQYGMTGMKTSASLEAAGQNGGLKLNCFLEDCSNSKPWLLLAFIISFQLLPSRLTFHLQETDHGTETPGLMMGLHSTESIIG